MRRLDQVADALLARRAPRVRALADVLLGQVVDVFLGPVPRVALDRTALDPRAVIAAALVGVPGHGDARVVLEVPVLATPDRGVDEDPVAAEVDPHRRRLRRP